MRQTKMNREIHDQLIIDFSIQLDCCLPLSLRISHFLSLSLSYIVAYCITLLCYIRIILSYLYQFFGIRSIQYLCVFEFIIDYERHTAFYINESKRKIETERDRERNSEIDKAKIEIAIEMKKKINFLKALKVSKGFIS